MHGELSGRRGGRGITFRTMRRTRWQTQLQTLDPIDSDSRGGSTCAPHHGFKQKLSGSRSPGAASSALVYTSFEERLLGVRSVTGEGRW